MTLFRLDETAASVAALSGEFTDSLHVIDQLILRWQNNPEGWNQLLLKVFGRTELLDLGVISIEILDGQTMAGLHGAYAPIAPNGDERIYLNGSWLAAAEQDDVEAVLLEELGHAIDHRLNGDNDTPGDEGAIFSTLIRGAAKPAGESTQNDHHTLIINGQAIAVEAAAPTLITSSSPEFSDIEINSGVPSGAVGTLVSALIDSGGSLDNFSDADGDLPAIAIIGTNLNGGTLYYSTNNGSTWSDVGTVSETSARALHADSDTRLAFAPATDFSGTISDLITFKAWDRNGANNGADSVTNARSLTGTYNTSGNAKGVAISADGNTAFVADRTSGLQIIDISNPGSPSLRSTFNTSGMAYDVVLSSDSNIAYVADYGDGLDIINVNDLDSPSLYGSYNTSGWSVEIALSADGNTAFIADRTAGLQIINVSDPVNPTRRGVFNTSSQAYGVSLSADGNTAFVGDGNHGLDIINVSDLANPSLSGNYHTPGSAHSVAISADGNTAFVADDEGGLQILNVSDHTSPTLRGSFSTTSYAESLSLSADGDTVYLADGSNGLQIINVSDLSNPSLISTFSTSDDAIDVVLSSDETTAYIADDSSGLQIISLGNSEHISTASDTASIRVGDSIPPSISISSDVASLQVGETATLTFTLSEASSNFVQSDVNVSGGTLSNWNAASVTVYSATFTPTADSTTNGVISVASGTFTDAANNANADGSDSNNTVTISVDTVKPTFQSAATITDGTKVILTYNETLSSTTAAATDFSVTTDSAANAITAVEISGATIELTLNNTVKNDQTVTVAYTDPSSSNDINAIQDSYGNDAASLTSTSVSNNSTVAGTAPTFSAAATNTDGTKVILTYNETLSSTTAAATDFSVTTDSAANAITAVEISGATIELTLTDTVKNDQTVTVAYTDPSSSNDINAIQDSYGNDAASLTSTSVSNNSTVAGIAPTFSAAATNTDGTKVILTYNETLSSTTAAATDFSVTTDSAANAITAVEISGATIELTLTNTVKNDQTVTVAYTDPSSSNDINAIQDSYGNDAASLTSTSVSNNSTVAGTAPTFSAAATNTDGTKVILTYNETLSSTTAAATDFSVTTDSAANAITAVEISGATIELTLNNTVKNDQTVTVAYTDPSSSNDINAIQDSYGNDAASLTSTSVSNNSTVTSPAPTPEPTPTPAPAPAPSPTPEPEPEVDTDTDTDTGDANEGVSPTPSSTDDPTLGDDRATIAEPTPEPTPEPEPEPDTDTDDANEGFIIITPTPSANDNPTPGDDPAPDSETSDTNSQSTVESLTITNISPTQTGSVVLVENSGNNDNRVIATLPPAVSIQCEGSFTAQSAEQAQQALAESILTRDASSSDQQQLIRQAQSFITTLPSNTQLDVRTITHTTASTAVGQQIVITGTTTQTSNTSSSSNSNTSQTEAFVIDFTQMTSSSPTQLQLHNIDLAVIIGPAVITGGTGRNVVHADNHPQSIVLGGDNDTINGGGGHDTIGSAAGNDVLIGGRGQDRITGGADNDTLRGGAKADILDGEHGNDLLLGGKGHDTIRGSEGHDTLKGRLFHDILKGGKGNDTLHGGKGHDTLSGGDGADTFHLSRDNDIIRDFSITDGDTINAPKQHNLSLIQQGNQLLLTDVSRNIHTTILNLSADQLISHQPDLF